MSPTLPKIFQPTWPIIPAAEEKVSFLGYFEISRAFVLPGANISVEM
jgi:hypothetical protein